MLITVDLSRLAQARECVGESRMYMAIHETRVLQVCAGCACQLPITESLAFTINCSVDCPSFSQIEEILQHHEILLG